MMRFLVNLQFVLTLWWMITLGVGCTTSSLSVQTTPDEANVFVVLIGNYPVVRGIILNDIPSAIIRAIINYDEFKVLKRLVQNTFYGFFQEPCIVPNCHQNSQFRQDAI